MAAPRPWPHPSGAQRDTGGGNLGSSQLSPCQLIKQFVKLKARKMIHKVSNVFQLVKQM